MYDVAIIGAGVVGAMICRELKKYRLDVCLLESGSDVASGQSKANSAIVHAGFDAENGTLKALLNVRGSEMMEEVTSQLGVKYKHSGALVLSFSEEDLPKLEALKARGDKNGVRGLEIVGKDRIRELEPNASENATAALWAPTSAIVCPYQLTIAAVGNAMDNGAKLFEDFSVSEISEVPGGYSLKAESGASVQAKYVIDSAGIRSDEIAALLKVDGIPEITARRGEYLLLDKTALSMKRTLFVLPGPMGKGILVSPTVDCNTLIGPTAENISDKNDTETTQHGLDSVMTQGMRMAKCLPRGSVITSFSGLRSSIVRKDGKTADFIIKQFGNSERGGVVLCGIDSPGLSASPAIAEYVRDMLFGMMEKTPDVNGSFDPFRRKTDFFAELSDSEKNELIRKDSSFGRMVCRCENITEGEIRLALTQNPRARDIDGVKRRTRAGMGRCQGGFCSPSVLEEIASEYGIPPEQVTKRGGNSFILVGKTK